MTAARAALYWAPDLDDPLHAAGSTWLGRDAEGAVLLPQPDLPGIAALTADPRGYGLHATLKPPFRLRSGYSDLAATAAAFAAGQAPFDLPSLAVEDLDGFLALREQAPCPALHALADAAVTALDPHRAATTPDELARRRPERLSPRQRELLDAWGYPYVFAEWRFHVTLTRRLSAQEMAVIRPAAEAFVGPAAARPRRIASVCLFVQAAPGAPFVIAERLALGG
ncbi:DUF1045 domain-containing protein [Humitalea sp. 24SJ18S-53]|uniref:DUF1045 domain-containing protein n=1 Tax=Humitalea sp. 24SJ18S-53 TaxID=3422307 RepID=UPI003D67774B